MTNDISWSNEQLAIFEWYADGTGSLVVQARAGTGKTTTIKVAMTHAPEDKILYAVFNKRNQREAAAAITDNRVEVKTLHALGYAFIRQVWRGAKPEDGVERERIEAVAKDIPVAVAGQVEKLVGFAKNTFCCLPALSELEALADARQIECPDYEQPQDGGWTVARLAEVAQNTMELSMERDAQNRISFNDMVWLPVAMNWTRKWYNLVVVDEAQDMNAPQMEMAVRACKAGGRICLVGDDRQAIYAFRGALQDGMNVMQRRLNAKVLGLTTTYRCPKAVVALAAELVPDYKAAPAAPEGVVEYIAPATLTARLEVGDAVLSRVNAPLMGLCLELLKKGTPARIEGKDIGKALAAVVRKLRARSVPDFIVKVGKWAGKQMDRAALSKNAEEKIDAIQDQAACLVAVAEGAASVGEIETRITNLFQDTDDSPRPAVVFSSTHKAKGLEWPTVYVLRDTYRVKGGPAPVSQESNLYYVAITRAKKHLVLVGAP